MFGKSLSVALHAEVSDGRKVVTPPSPQRDPQSHVSASEPLPKSPS